jgi:hypothetical protein
MIQMFSDFRSYLESDVEASDTLLMQIPFTQQSLKAMLPLADAFATQVSDKLDFYRPRVDLSSIGTNGAIVKDSQTFTASGAGFTADLVNQSLSFLDADDKIVRTFPIQAVVDSSTLTLAQNAPETVTNQRFVVHKPLEKVQTLQ